VPFDDVGEPIRAINAQPKPLALYVFSGDEAVAEEIIAQTAAGGSCVNAVMSQYLHANLPFGGINNSGIGSAHGQYGFRAFSHERAVLKDRFSAAPMLFPPYSRRVRRMIKLILRFLT
jgi:NAD-dependent aldehyde dehydrogenases